MQGPLRFELPECGAARTHRAALAPSGQRVLPSLFFQRHGGSLRPAGFSQGPYRTTRSNRGLNGPLLELAAREGLFAPYGRSPLRGQRCCAPLCVRRSRGGRRTAGFSSKPRHATSSRRGPAGPLRELAEREGFEPSMGFKAHTPLAGERLQPLGHLSDCSCVQATDYIVPARTCTRGHCCKARSAA